jgi:hypothetical protein
MSSNVFSLPIIAPSITLTGPDGLVTDLIDADEVATPLVRPKAPAAGSGVAGEDLRVEAADGADSASVAGGKGGDLELFAGDAGTGTSGSNGGSVILRAGNSTAPGLGGLVRVENGPFTRQCRIIDKGPGQSNLNISDLRAGFIRGAPPIGPVNYTLPSASLIVQGFPGIQVDDTIFFSVANEGAQNISLIGVGFTFTGSVVTLPGTSGSFGLIASNVQPSTEAFKVFRVS